MQNLWSALDGRKTLIGSVLAVIYAGAVSQGLIDRNLAVEAFIEGFLGVGLAHRAYKA